MCFNQPMSYTLAAIGLSIACYLYFKKDVNVKNAKQLSYGVFFFFLMELLQGIQYSFIDECDNFWNRLLTAVGFAHICLQPFFTHLMNASFTKNPITLAKWDVVLKLSLIGAIVLFARFITSGYFPELAMVTGEQSLLKDASKEWLRADGLCTYSGNLHLAWQVPLRDVSYYVPSLYLHLFLMFAPFLIIRKQLIIQGVILFITGPMFAGYMTDNLQEQASIWCGVSIGQIAIMVFLVASAKPKSKKLKSTKTINGPTKVSK